jgi:two-component system cell cycle response regulator
MRPPTRSKASGGSDRLLPRKTTEVRLESEADLDPVERARTLEPALILLEGDLPGQVFRLRPGRQVIGRRPECDIRVRERAVSGTHAEIIRLREAVTIRDLESTNGTQVNGSRIKGTVTLAAGHLLKLGNCVFRFVDSLLEVEFTETLHARGISDTLTGAFNRIYLTSRLGFAIDTASPTKPVSVIAFDLDEFKQVNDRFGHAAGDHILRSIAGVISSEYVQTGEVFARMGGEEFAIILPETPAGRAHEVAEQIRRRIEEEEFSWEEAPIRLTASFGVATATSNLETPEAVLDRADEALYESKRKGRNRVS